MELEIKLVYGREAVSNILGAVLLMLIVIISFAVIYSNVIQTDDPQEKMYTAIVGRAEPLGDDVFGSQIIFEHRKGEPIPVDSKICFMIAGCLEKSFTVNDLLSEENKQDGYWNIGENLVFADEKIQFLNVDAEIDCLQTNERVFYGIVQTGYSIPPESIPIQIDFLPNTFNIDSQGQWVTCKIRLPEPYDVNDVDISSLHIKKIGDINVEIFVEPKPVMVQNSIMCKFDRSDIAEYLSPGFIGVVVSGCFFDGLVLEYLDTIRVIQ